MSSKALQNLINLGLELPRLPDNKALFKPYIFSKEILYISGQLPLGFGDLNKYVGQLGKEFNIEQGQDIARICALNVLAQVNAACHDNLDKVKQCLKLTVFVNSAPTFIDQPKVANAASELMLQVFKDKGHHARSAIGVSQLPFGVGVEIEAIFETETKFVGKEVRTF
jgi:enamine deaminase RidA (YjgF/YER057c/UK114 family)